MKADYIIVDTGAEVRSKMLKGVNTLADAVKSTLGPRGRHVAIERPYGPPLITKDGVTVAKKIYLKDKVENMGAQLVKSVAASANSVAGDGTTTATVLAQAIYKNGLKYVDGEGVNPVLIKRGIDIGIKKVSARLRGLAAKIDDEESMISVATISANNDYKLGSKIAEAVAAVGQYGVISVEEAAGGATEVFYSEGLKLDRGWLSEHFVTNEHRMTAEFENCLILPYNGKINSIHELADILSEVIKAGRPILIVAKDIEDEAINHLAFNKVQNGLKVAVIRSPGYGDMRRAFLEDLAIVSDGKMYSDDDGIGLKNVQMQDLGEARRVVVGQNTTMVIDGKASDEVVAKRAEDIREQMNDPNLYNLQLQLLSSRLARITGSAAIFKVGGKSEAEMRERKDRVEDAVNAVKSALEEGVVPGGGSSLIHCIPALDEIDTADLLPEEVIGIEIVKSAIQEPFKQILKNAGVGEEDFIERMVSSDDPAGYDALRLEFVDNMLQRGIMDPCKVVRSALEYAGSASGTLLTTEVTISEPGE